MFLCRRLVIVSLLSTNIDLGKDTKAMLNNSGPRYKRSSLEKLTNWDIIWCVVLLFLMCISGAIFSSVWLNSFESPYSVQYLDFSKETSDFSPSSEGMMNFWRFIVVLQVRLFSSKLFKLEQSIKLINVYKGNCPYQFSELKNLTLQISKGNDKDLLSAISHIMKYNCRL